MHHEADVGLVYAHAESYGGHNHIHLFKQESVLVGGAGGAVHAGVVGQHTDFVHTQGLGQLLHPLAAQTVYYAAFARVILDVSDNVAVYLGGLGTHLIIKVRAIEAGLVYVGVGHAQIFLDVMLHLGGGGGCEGNYRAVGNLIYKRTNLAVFRTEIVSPFGDAVGLVHCIEADGDGAQEHDVLLLGKAFGSYIQEFGAA